MAERWTAVVRPAHRPARARVVAFPHAGAGPGALLPLLTLLPGDIEVVGVTGPGRERRFAERVPVARPDPLAVVAAVRAELAGCALPTVLFGHSMGAALAGAVAAAHPDGCAGVVLSAYPGTGTPAQRAGRWTDDDVLGILRHGGATPDEVLDSPPWRQYLIELLRHDLTLSSRLVGTTDLRRIPGPVTLLRGADDDLVEPVERVVPGAAWHRRTLPGGHFSLLDEPTAGVVAAEIVAVLDAGRDTLAATA